jgi:hypothetical protein
MWRDIYQVEWTEEAGYLCLKASWQGDTFLLPPFGEETDIVKILDKMEEYFRQENKPFLLRGVEADMVKWLEKARPGYFQCLPDRDSFDYVYLTQELIELKGRKYHKKKNHLNFFQRTYPYEYREMTGQTALDCIDFLDEWYAQRAVNQEDALALEKVAVREALTHFGALGITGGIIYIEGRIKAFTFGEPLNADTVVVHVEKGDNEIRGIYAAINQCFCEHHWQNYTYINREEDMGLEGLRLAKESYYPVKMTEKYEVTIF